MKKTMLTFILVFSLWACGSYVNTFNMNANLKKIELGMTKKEVISIMGNHYSNQGALRTFDGRDLESLRYESVYDYYIIFNFENGQLVEWYDNNNLPSGPSSLSSPHPPL